MSDLTQCIQPHFTVDYLAEEMLSLIRHDSNVIRGLIGCNRILSGGWNADGEFWDRISCFIFYSWTR